MDYPLNKMNKLSYTKATIYLPEWYKRYNQKLKANEGTLEGWGLSFTRGDYCIHAEIWPYSIPIEFSNNPEIKTKILIPSIEAVVADIKPIEDLLKEFRSFVKAGKLQENLFYEKEPVLGESFKFYDYMGSRNGEPFKKLIKFKGIPDQLLKKKYQEFPKLANSICQENGNVPYIQGKTLRESAERALRIYQLSEKLKKINF